MTDAAELKTFVLSRFVRHISSRSMRLAAFFAFAIFFLTLSSVQAQQPDDTPEGYPPPLKIIPKEEKNLLTAESDPKRHTGLALQLSDAHLEKAEELSVKSDFVHMYSELGAFNAVIDEVLQFIEQHDDGGGKILNSSKKLEIGLRSYAPRLETIRRDLPLSYEPYVKSLIKTVRNARSKAVEPFFGTSVVPQPKNN